MSYSKLHEDTMLHKQAPAHAQFSNPAKLSLLLFLVMCLPLMFVMQPKPSKSFGMPQSTMHPMLQKRPLIVYTKPRKTGSTFIASMLGTAVLRSGGRVAPCAVAASFTPDASYYGLVRGFDLLGCHLTLNNLNIPALLRIPREVVFVTSIREPMSWFLSAAVWVFEKKMSVVVDSKQLLHKAIDHALDGNASEFRNFRRLFLGNYGLDETASNASIAKQASIYSYVFDHSTAEDDVNEALVELGYAPSRPSSRREGVYDSSWYDGYRKSEIERVTQLEARIYELLRKSRDARRLPQAGWASLDRDEVKVVYSAIPGKRRDAQRTTGSAQQQRKQLR